jgi:hypothetical protein
MLYELFPVGFNVRREQFPLFAGPVLVKCAAHGKAGKTSGYSTRNGAFPQIESAPMYAGA